MATKEDLKRLPTKEDLNAQGKHFKEDLKDQGKHFNETVHALGRDLTKLIETKAEESAEQHNTILEASTNSTTNGSATRRKRFSSSQNVPGQRA